MSQSSKSKNVVNLVNYQQHMKNINLPKLDRIIVKNSNYKHNNIEIEQKKQYQVDLGNMLKI